MSGSFPVVWVLCAAAFGWQEELEQSDIEQREDVVVVTVYLDTMILIAEEIHESPYTGYKFGKDEIFTAQVVFLENVLKAGPYSGGAWRGGGATSC